MAWAADPGLAERQAAGGAAAAAELGFPSSLASEVMRPPSTHQPAGKMEKNILATGLTEPKTSTSLFFSQDGMFDSGDPKACVDLLKQTSR